MIYHCRWRPWRGCSNRPLRQALAGQAIMVVIQTVDVVARRAAASLEIGLGLGMGRETLAVLVACGTEA